MRKPFVFTLRVGDQVTVTPSARDGNDVSAANVDFECWVTKPKMARLRHFGRAIRLIALAPGATVLHLRCWNEDGNLIQHTRQRVLVESKPNPLMRPNN